jgi:hypothetical protein
MLKTDPSQWLRGITKDFHFEIFQEAVEKSKKDCPDLLKIKELMLLMGVTFATFHGIPSFIENGFISDRYSQRLFFTCFVESFRSIIGTMYLSACGLYRNAYHNIRYMLESMIQSEYIDTTFPNVDFERRLNILRKGENEELRMNSLLKEINLQCKGGIINEWKNLSKRVHPSHQQLIDTAVDFMSSTYGRSNVECNEVTNIYKSLRAVCNFYLYLIFVHFPEVKTPLKENKDFVKTLNDHKLRLASKEFWRK